MTYANLAKALHTEASHRDDEDNKPRKNPSIGAMVALARLLDGRSLYAAFGAPGDWGYETPVGEALSSLYMTPDARPTTARMAFGPVASLVEEFTAENDKLRARLTEWRGLVEMHKNDADTLRHRVGSLETERTHYVEQLHEANAEVATLRARVAEWEVQHGIDRATIASMVESIKRHHDRGALADINAVAVTGNPATARTPLVRCGECTAAVGHFGDCAKGGAL